MNVCNVDTVFLAKSVEQTFVPSTMSKCTDRICAAYQDHYQYVSAEELMGTVAHTCITDGACILRDHLVVFGTTFLSNSLEELGCNTRNCCSLPLSVVININESIFSRWNRRTSRVCTPSKGLSTNAGRRFFQYSAVFLNPAPGNQLGTYFTEISLGRVNA
jgi:hypothetical protein